MLEQTLRMPGRHCGWRRGRCMPFVLPGLPRSWTACRRRKPASFATSDFAAAAQELLFLPGDDGVVGAALGLGDDTSPARIRQSRVPSAGRHAWRLQRRATTIRPLPRLAFVLAPIAMAH